MLFSMTIFVFIEMLLALYDWLANGETFDCDSKHWGWAEKQAEFLEIETKP